MLTAFALMIERREFREFYVLRSEIVFRIDSEVSPAIRAALIDCDNFAVAYVGNCVCPFQDFERLPCLIVDFEIARHA